MKTCSNKDSINYRNAFLLVLFFSAITCNRDKGEDPVSNSSHIKYFGFTLIDTYWDDPTDAEDKTTYTDEVSAFTNVGDIIAVNPSDNLLQNMMDMNSFGMRVLLHLNEIFFEANGTNNLSGINYDLRIDFKERWDEFVLVNQIQQNTDLLAAFYIGEEPTWNGISFGDLNSATQYVKGQFPNVPIMIVEAHPTVNDLIVPESADWIGFNHYFVKDPTTNSAFQQEWNVIKSKRSKFDQKLVVIMDSHYIEFAHGKLGDIELREMKNVANKYFKLAQSNSSVIAIIGYFWPNGFDFSESIGARGMPAEVQQEYIRIGKEIIE